MNKQKLHYNRLFQILGIRKLEDLKTISKNLSVSAKMLEYYNNNRIFPDGKVLEKILEFMGYSKLELKIRLGILDDNMIKWIANNPRFLLEQFKDQETNNTIITTPDFQTEYGSLYQSDCIEVMKNMDNDSVDLIFADPPFNLGKKYESGMDDYLSEEEYLLWTETWLLECVRILKPGGSLFIYNLPYWQTQIANILNKYLNFRHWIALYMRGLMPVSGKLLPSHYGLLYYVKGERPSVFNKQRIPMPTCRHCGGEIHDYGGKKKDLDFAGLSIADVWTDIHPVRHKKFKNRASNELPVKLLHRVISLASNEGDIVFDPFGGSGTTYAVAECLRRHWIGCEIGSIDPIINRLQDNDDCNMIAKVEKETNVIFTEDQKLKRRKNNFWLLEDLK